MKYQIHIKYFLSSTDNKISSGGSFVDSLCYDELIELLIRKVIRANYIIMKYDVKIEIKCVL